MRPLLPLLLLACTTDPPVDTDPVDTDTPTPALQPTWRGGVRDLLDVRCEPCHTSYAFGDLGIGTRGDLVDAPSSIGMPYVTPGDLTSSYLWYKLLDTQDEVGGDGDRMPLDVAPFDADEMTLIETWIEDGAPLE